MPDLFKKLKLEGADLELFLTKIEMIKKTLNEIDRKKVEEEIK